METKLTEQQSLAVISEMIDRARNNIQKGNADSMIFWGYAVAGTAILNFILLHVLPDPNVSFWVWALMIPCSVVNYFIKRKIDRDAIVKTQIDTIVSSAWSAYGAVTVTFIAFIFFMAYSWNNYQLFLLITPVIMLMVAIAQYVTAKSTRFKPFTYGAIIMWAGSVCAVASFFILKRGDIQFLVLALCIILCYVIPGHLLNKKARRHV